MARSVDSIRGFIDAGGEAAGRRELTLTGWALGPAGPADRLMLLVDGRFTGVVAGRRPRPELREAHPGIPDAELGGWEATLDLGLATGEAAEIVLLAAWQGGPWHELAREWIRLEPWGADGKRRRRAVFTIVQNEADFLPLWLGYYGRHFDAQDIYVLDHDSTDGSTAGLASRCNVVAVHRDKSFDHVWLRTTVESFQAFLLRAYETVLFAEADEFVVPDPEHHAGLGAYVDSLGGPAARCTGFNVVHYPQDGEPPLGREAPLLAQRGFWHHSLDYSKTLLSKVPLRWTVGFHAEWTLPELDPDPALYLVHLHRVDYDRCLARHRAATARDWSKDDLALGYGRQSRVVEDDEFGEWFFRGDDLEGSTREPIPERLAAAL